MNDNAAKGARDKLAQRRQNRTRHFVWVDPGGNGHPMDVTVGFREAGRAPGFVQKGGRAEAGAPVLGEAAEIFIAGPREGSTLLHTLEDGCVMASILAQMGVPFAELRRHLGRHGSPMGPILDQAEAMLAEARAEAAGDGASGAEAAP